MAEDVDESVSSDDESDGDRGGDDSSDDSGEGSGGGAEPGGARIWGGPARVTFSDYLDRDEGGGSAFERYIGASPGERNSGPGDAGSRTIEDAVGRAMEFLQESSPLLLDGAGGSGGLPTDQRNPMSGVAPMLQALIGSSSGGAVPNLQDPLGGHASFSKLAGTLEMMAGLTNAFSDSAAQGQFMPGPTTLSGSPLQASIQSGGIVLASTQHVPDPSGIRLKSMTETGPAPPGRITIERTGEDSEGAGLQPKPIQGTITSLEPATPPPAVQPPRPPAPSLLSIVRDYPFKNAPLGPDEPILPPYEPPPPARQPPPKLPVAQLANPPQQPEPPRPPREDPRDPFPFIGPPRRVFPDDPAYEPRPPWSDVVGRQLLTGTYKAPTRRWENLSPAEEERLRKSGFFFVKRSDFDMAVDQFVKDHEQAAREFQCGLVLGVGCKEHGGYELLGELMSGLTPIGPVRDILIGLDQLADGQTKRGAISVGLGAVSFIPLGKLIKYPLGALRKAPLGALEKVAWTEAEKLALTEAERLALTNAKVGLNELPRVFNPGRIGERSLSVAENQAAKNALGISTAGAKLSDHEVDEVAEQAAASILKAADHKVLGTIQKEGQGHGLDLVTRSPEGRYFVWEIKGNGSRLTDVQRMAEDFVGSRLDAARLGEAGYGTEAQALAQRIWDEIPYDNVSYLPLNITGIN